MTEFLTEFYQVAGSVNGTWFAEGKQISKYNSIFKRSGETKRKIRKGQFTVLIVPCSKHNGPYLLFNSARIRPKTKIPVLRLT